MTPSPHLSTSSLRWATLSEKWFWTTDEPFSSSPCCVRFLLLLSVCIQRAKFQAPPIGWNMNYSVLTMDPQIFLKWCRGRRGEKDRCGSCGHGLSVGSQSDQQHEQPARIYKLYRVMWLYFVAPSLIQSMFEPECATLSALNVVIAIKVFQKVIYLRADRRPLSVLWLSQPHVLITSSNSLLFLFLNSNPFVLFRLSGRHFWGGQQLQSFIPPLGFPPSSVNDSYFCHHLLISLPFLRPVLFQG